jgi:solute:Na+ symporter, SSS family
MAEGGFSILDWGVLAGYFALLLGIGVWASRARKRPEGKDGGKADPSGERAGDFFLGGRRMPMWAVAASVLATATSAATFIGGPEEAFVGNLTYLSTNIGTILGVVIVALVFIPAFYRNNVTTVYDLLDRRFGPAAKVAASWMFLIGRIFANGSRIFVAAIPASLIFFGDAEPRHMIVATAVLVVLGIFTAFGGGIRTVIWTDVLQVCVLLLVAGAALLVLFSRIPLGLGEIYSTLASTPVGEGSKLTVIDPGLKPGRGAALGFDPAQPYTMLTVITGFALLSIAAYGTDHDLTQRMLTCKNAVKGGGSALLAMVINLPMVAIFMSIGLLLHIYYQRPDLMGDAAPAASTTQSPQVFLRFIIDAMPPGLTGLMMAGLFAVGIGSLNSALAAMSAAFINDAYRPLRPGRGDRHYVWAGRAAVVGWGVVLGGFAVLCVYWFGAGSDTILMFVLGAMTFAYAGLLGVFLTALLTRRGNSASAIAALGIGFVAVALMQPPVWAWWTSQLSWAAATPDMDDGFRLGELRLAFPWRLTIATALALAVCMAGKPREQPDG